MAASVHKAVAEMDSGPKCLLCSQQFTDPRTLPCFHSFCLQCLRLYQDLTCLEKNLNCPVCERSMPLPRDGIDGLKCSNTLQRLMVARDGSAGKTNSQCNGCDNTILIKYCKTCSQNLCGECVAKHEQETESENHELIPTQSLSETGSLVCQLCDYNAASRYCTVCEMPICSSCEEMHRKIPATKNHAIRDITASDETIICQVCEGGTSTMYCEDCNQQMCESCTKMHTKIPSTKSHSVVSNDVVLKKPPRLLSCKDHPTMTLESFCEACKILICEECSVLDHNAHKRQIKAAATSTESKPESTKSAKGAKYGPSATGNSAPTKTNRQQNSISKDDQRLIRLNLPDALITRHAALGHTAALGQLYDERTNKFRQESIIDRNSDIGEIDVSDEVSIDVKLFNPKSLTSKCEAFGLSPCDKLNILLNRVKPSGHSEILLDVIQDEDVKAGGLLLSIIKKKERIKTLQSRTFRANMTAISEEATHAIIGIDWGFGAAIISENVRNDTIMHDVSQDAIDSEIRSIYRHLSSSTSTEKKKQKQQHKSATICNGIRVFHDQLPVEFDVPLTDEERTSFIYTLPSKILSLKKCDIVPVAYYLVRLEHIDILDKSDSSVTPSIVEAESNEKLLSVAVKYLDEMQEINEKMHDLKGMTMSIVNYVTAANSTAVQNLCDQISGTERSFKRFIRADILEYRSRQDKTATEHLQLQFSELHNFESSLDDFKSKYRALKKLIKYKISVLETLSASKVKCFGGDTSLQEFKRQINHGLHFVLIFDVRSSNFDTCREIFIDKVREWRNCENECTVTPSESNTVKYAAVDLEVCPQMAEEYEMTAESNTCIYENGEYQLLNLEEEMKNDKNLNLARTRTKHEEIPTLPMKRALVKLTCPNSLRGSCPKIRRDWLCHLCKKNLQYDVTDKKFYCICGCAPVSSYRFKCESVEHGRDFVGFRQHEIETELGNLDPVKEVTILVLGETGVGKSTWINSIVNYINYETLKEARDVKDIPFLIPTSFSIFDDSYEPRNISLGAQSDDEILSDQGQSATQDPKAYHFQAGDVNVQLIDTPGIGDVRGAEQDRENFDKILRFLSTIKELHGICVLVKPNESRLTIVFRYCITELLTHLHRSAASNIIFCYTNARGTFYKPGDSLRPLRTLLTAQEKNSGVNILTNVKTMYCLDNEAFRFLCAVREGVHFSEQDVDNFSTSWDKSRAETERLFTYILQLTPHKLVDTLSLNEARNIILRLTKPIAEMSRNIEINIAAIASRKEEIKNLDIKDTDLRQKLYIPQITLKAHTINYPMTVCTRSRCIETRLMPGTTISQTVYKTVCHRPCGLRNVKPEVISDPELRGCAAMHHGACKKCGCSWDMHMHVTYELQELIEEVMDTQTAELLQHGATDKQLKQSTISKMEGTIAELEASRKTIANITAKFGSFLKSNAIVPYNDAYDAYIEFKIKEEKERVDAGGTDVTLKSLQQMRAAYREQVDILNNHMQHNSTAKIGPEEIVKLRDELFALKDKGEELKRIADVAQQASLLHNPKQTRSYVHRVNNTRPRGYQRNFVYYLWNRMRQY